MTISTTIIKNSYSGDGSTTVFPYTFKINAEADIQVIIRAANGTETVKTLTTDYTISGVGSASGGNVTMVTAPSATETLVIRRETIQTQTVDLVENDPFTAETVEGAFDKSIAVSQELQEEVDRSIKLSRTNTMTSTEFTVDAATRANKILAFDSAGEISVTQELGTYKGNWAASTSYSARDIVKDTTTNNIFIANTAHTSSGSLPLTTNTDSAKWDLIVDAASATASASAAATSATNAANSATAAATSASNAATSESNAATSASTATTQATNASNSATAAANSASAAEAYADNFDDAYLGAKASNPSVDNDGDPLADGALYFDTTNNVMKVYDLGTTTWYQLTPTVANQTNINIVSGISSEVQTVSSDSADIQTVASDSADIRTLADIEDGTVATNAVSNAGNNSTNITTVAGQISPTNNIATVASANANITTVAGQISPTNNIATVAGANANISTVASNLTGTNTIGTVAGSIANVNLTGGSIANVNVVGNNIGTVNNFADRYRVQAGEPSVDNDEGDLVYDTNANAVKVFNGTSFDTIQQGITDVAPTRHSIRPSLNLDFANSKALDPRITFTRASNATYYDGYTSVKAEENLLEYSQDFSGWIPLRNSVTTNATTAPDGTTTADELSRSGDTNNTVYYQNIQVIGNQNYVYSFYAKSNGKDYCILSEGASPVTFGATSASWINLTNGTVGTEDSDHNIIVTDVGNSWYRISTTLTAYENRSASFRVETAETDNSRVMVDDGQGIYVWGGQLEQRDSLTAYTPTTSSPITKYQPALQTAGNNVARFDHNPTTGESLGLLIEESRTNLLIISEDFSNANWNKLNTSITSNTIIAPDGTLTGDKIIPDSGSSSHYIYESITVSTGNDYVASVYAKKGEYDYIRINNRVDNTSRSAWFNISNGTVGTVQSGLTASIQDVGNGWYRCSAVASVTSSTTATMYITPTDADNTTYVSSPDGYSGNFIWGATYEQGSFPTSYIKTTGSQVTRSADDAEILNIDTSDWFNNQEGTLYTNLNINTLSNTNVAGVSLGDNNNLSDNRIEMRAVGTSTSIPRFDMTTNGVSQLLIQAPNLGSETNRRLSLSYSMNDYNVSITANGNSVTSDTDGNIPILNKLVIGKAPYNNLQQLGGTIKKVSYYPIALTDNEIIDLTEE